MKIRAWLGWSVVMLMAGALTACAASSAVSAVQVMLPTSTSTVQPEISKASPTVHAQRVPTRTPSATPPPTNTAAPTATSTPLPQPIGPTPVLTPVPIAPPVWDGVLRTANVPILMYHYISAVPDASDRLRYGLSVPPEAFEAQLQMLREQGFTTITLWDLYEYLAVGQQLPDRPIILTFDDGYLDNYTEAFPLLQKYGMVGTFFVLTGRADDGDPGYLSWDMITEMSQAGMDLQLHLRDHLDMRNRSYDWLVFQVIGGRQSIEGHTGKPVIFMAYPSGKYDANVLRFLDSANFWAAVTTANGAKHTLNNALTWDRLRIAGQMSLRDFTRLLNLNTTAPRSLPGPIATATAMPIDSAKPDNPTATPTSDSRPVLTSTAQRPTIPPDLTRFPIQTPERSPLPTSTSVQLPPPTPTAPQSPLITPTLPQSPLMTPSP